ncbi:MAG: GGDEF domain-containing protein [Pseudomonadota bacterium]
MSSLTVQVLTAAIESSIDPVVLLRTDSTDWPIELANPAFAKLAAGADVSGPFAELCETLCGRESALEIGEAIRSGEETRLPVELGGYECVLNIKPLSGKDEARYAAVYVRDLSGGLRSQDDSELSQALLKAKRRIRDLDRDDPVTGLLNERAFREVVEHDWAVAARERSSLALVRFELCDFDAYLDVFGRHASDSCLRRVGQTVRRCLRRASDVVARLDDNSFAVLSHAADEEGVRGFAERIAAAVRELGLHHPRSSRDRFVTIGFEVEVRTAGSGQSSIAEVLDRDVLPED